MNNLYGFGQSCRIPVGGYEWMMREEIAAMDWAATYNENGTTDYILEVDLDCMCSSNVVKAVCMLLISLHHGL